MKNNNIAGFSTIELLVTLFIAAAFLVSGYQLYNLIIKDSGETRAQARANNVAYDYLQRYKDSTGAPCVAQTALEDESISVPNLNEVKVTVVVECPGLIGYKNSAPTTPIDITSLSKIIVTVKYGNESPQKEVTNATYVNK